MAQLETETRKCIDEYYNNILEKFEFIKRELQKEYKIRIRQDFENDEDVITIQRLFSKLRKKYKYLSLECEMRDWELERNNEYKEMKEWKDCEDKIQALRKERALLITELEVNPKNSTEYKEAHSKLKKLFK